MPWPYDNQQPQTRMQQPTYGARLSNALRNPAITAALLQFGINMLQPGRGGTVSQIGRSFGAGAEAAGRVQGLERKQKQTEQEVAFKENQAQQGEAFRRDELAQRQREAQSLENYRKASIGIEKSKAKTTAKGLSLNTLFNSEQAKLRRYTDWITKQAETEVANNIDLENPKTVDSLISDPVWRAQKDQLYQSITSGPGAAGTGAPATGAPPPQMQVSGQALEKSDLGAAAPAGGTDVQNVLQQAREALAVATPEQRARILQRLVDMGISTEGL